MGNRRMPLAMSARKRCSCSTAMVVVVIVAVFTLSAPPAPADPEAVPAAARRAVWRNIAYDTQAGVAPELLSLDVYSPATGTALPIAIMIHGGGWQIGDKSHAGVAREKARFFNEHGFVFVSINYRLSPQVQHPVHIRDVARAVAFVIDQAATYHGDPKRIFVMGHSAGGHLAALVATDARFLAAVGKPLNCLRGCIVLDTDATDIPRAVASGRDATLFVAAFGNDPQVWADASPINHIAAGKGIPPFLVFVAQPNRRKTKRAEEFVTRLRAAGVPTELMICDGHSHRDINTDIGRPDSKPTAAILEFVRRYSNP